MYCLNITFYNPMVKQSRHSILLYFVFNLLHKKPKNYSLYILLFNAESLLHYFNSELLPRRHHTKWELNSQHLIRLCHCICYKGKAGICSVIMIMLSFLILRICVGCNLSFKLGSTGFSEDTI